VTILDTQAFLHDVLSPELLSRAARSAIERAAQRGTLALCTISLWEVAMLERRHRIDLYQGAERFLERSLQVRGITLLSITPSIAAISATEGWHDWDPGDRIIAATAIDRRAKLVTSDRRLQATKLLDTVW
jgi:PIN domain nuclease of toxin-antitoxin system